MSPLTCSECGTPAEPGQAFCDTCRAVLSWGPPSGDRPARATTPTTRPSEVVPVDPRRLPGTGAAPAAARKVAPPGGRGVDPRVPHTAAPAPSTAVRSAAPPAADPAATLPEQSAERPAGRTAAGTGSAGRPATGSVQLGKSGSHRTAAAPRPPTGPLDPASDPATTATTVPVRRPGADSDSHPARTAAAPPEHGGPPEEMADRARNLLIPVAEPPAPVHEGVLPALPGKPSSVPLRSKGPGAESGIAGGDPCGWCGTPNRPDRHYCVRCAMPLDPADRDGEPARLPWWRRLLGRDDERLHWAGERPRIRRTYAHLLRWAVVAAIGTLLLTGLFKLPAAISATQDHFAVRTNITPDQYGASRSYQDQPPAHAFDLYSDTWWGPGVQGVGAGEWIQADFDGPTSILDLVVTPGVSERGRDLDVSAQPRRMDVLVTTYGGESFTRAIELPRGAGAKRVPFRAHDVQSIRFTIVSAYGADSDKQVAIAEIEFFGPSGSYGRR